MRPPTRRHRPRLTATLLAGGILAGAGGAAAGWAVTHQASAPQPSAAAAGRLDVPGPASQGPASDAPATAASVTSRGPLLRRSTPVQLTIPAIGVSTRLLRLGLNPDGTLEVPAPGPDYDRAAWFTGSPTPGEAGPAVIEGHVDSAADGPSVFFRLGALTPGDRVHVTRADGVTAEFTVDGVRRYPKDAFPTGLVYGNTDHAALRLITCGGSFDAATGHYRDDIVVFAHLTAVRRR